MPDAFRVTVSDEHQATHCEVAWWKSHRESGLWIHQASLEVFSDCLQITIYNGNREWETLPLKITSEQGKAIQQILHKSVTDAGLSE